MGLIIHKVGDLTENQISPPCPQVFPSSQPGSFHSGAPMCPTALAPITNRLPQSPGHIHAQLCYHSNVQEATPLPRWNLSHGSQAQWFSTWPHTGNTWGLLKDPTTRPLSRPIHLEFLRSNFTAPHEIPRDSQDGDELNLVPVRRGILAAALVGGRGVLGPDYTIIPVCLPPKCHQTLNSWKGTSPVTSVPSMH